MKYLKIFEKLSTPVILDFTKVSGNETTHGSVYRGIAVVNGKKFNTYIEYGDDDWVGLPVSGEVSDYLFSLLGISKSEWIKNKQHNLRAFDTDTLYGKKFNIEIKNKKLSSVIKESFNESSLDFNKIPGTPATIKTKDPKELLNFFEEQKKGLKYGLDQMKKFGGPISDTQKEYLADIKSYDLAIAYIKKNMVTESRSSLKSSEFEDSYHYDSEKEAKRDLGSSGFRFKGYIIPGDGFEHIWIEQWEKQGEETPIARLIWLDNVSAKPAEGQRVPNVMQGAQVTYIQPGHPKYTEAKQMKFGEGSKSYPHKD